MFALFCLCWIKLIGNIIYGGTFIVADNLVTALEICTMGSAYKTDNILQKKRNIFDEYMPSYLILHIVEEQVNFLL